MIKQITAASLLAFAAMPAFAQEEEPHGDIEGSVVGSQIVITGGETLAGFGRAFEGDFGDENEGPYITDAPGFDIDDFGAGNILAFNVVGPLQFWDGSSWGLAPTSGTGAATVSIEDGFGATFDIDGSSVLTGLIGVGAAEASGEAHDHVDFSINPDAAVGRYLFEIALFGYDSYTPDLINPNNGIYGNQIFTASENVFVELHFDGAPVPLPAAWLFMLSGLGSLLLGRRIKS